MQINWFHIYQGDQNPQYTINLALVSDVNREDSESWEIATASGMEYTLEGEDLRIFREKTGL